MKERPDSHVAIVSQILPIYSRLYNAAYPQHHPDLEQALDPADENQTNFRLSYLLEYGMASAKDPWAHDSSIAAPGLSEALTSWMQKYNLRDKWVADGVLHICEVYTCKPALLEDEFFGAHADGENVYTKSIRLMYHHPPSDSSLQYIGCRLSRIAAA